MDLNNFNNKFPSWENQYKNIQKQKSIQQNIIIKSMFSEKYPNIEFNDLTKQTDNCLTNDGCIHYLDQTTNKVYSFNYIKNQWIEHRESYQERLMNMFVT